MTTRPSYLHPLERGTEVLPSLFTFPFRYTPHPLCQQAALIVQEQLKAIGITEGKMYGVLVCKIINNKDRILDNQDLCFLAAYSGQLNGSYEHPWFVPPVVDYLDSNSHFQKEQASIMELGERMEAMRESEEVRQAKEQLAKLKLDRYEKVEEAKRTYKEGKGKRDEGRGDDYIRMRQFQKANIHRAKQLYKDEIVELEGLLATHHADIKALFEQRKRRSEALQNWLFEQFVFLNGRGEQKGLLDIWNTSKASLSSSRGSGVRVLIPSGAGECCAPKLLQAAYKLGLQPLAMAEFWWGTSAPGHYHEPGAFYPACHSKCRPILGHMLQGLNMEPDPANHYENRTLAPIRVVWEDEYLAIINKPEGWCSIPGKSDQPNLFDECYRLWPDIEGSVIVHRLDQDTSGIMVIAKSARVHRALSQQFERREVKKRYIALLEKTAAGQGDLPLRGAAKGSLSLPLCPDMDNLPRQRVDWKNGKEAVTFYEVLGEEEGGVRVGFYPQTGRTHQLRVHAAAPDGLGAPIVGDRLYGHVANRLYLHAETIDFMHPVTHERLHFEVATPF